MHRQAAPSRPHASRRAQSMLFAGCALASAARDGARSERAGSLWELASLRRGVELVQPRELLRFLRPPPPAALTWLLLKVDARKLISRHLFLFLSHALFVLYLLPSLALLLLLSSFTPSLPTSLPFSPLPHPGQALSALTAVDLPSLPKIPTA